jgi:hypothetical protein
MRWFVGKEQVDGYLDALENGRRHPQVNVTYVLLCVSVSR